MEKGILMEKGAQKNAKALSLAILVLGFASGVPFLLTLSTLSFRLAESGISHTKIGLFVLVTIPYCLKFLWAPFLDTLSNPLSRLLGRRKSWLLISQFGVILGLLGLGLADPQKNISLVALCGFVVSFFASTQDILIDVFRIELISKSHQGRTSALESVGFRLGMIVSGAGALHLASLFNWFYSYALMAVCVLLTMPIVYFLPKEKVLRIVRKDKIMDALYSTIHSFSIKTLITMIVFIFAFKFSDVMLNAMSAPFLHDLGFSKVEYANITKIIGIALMLSGSVAGGFFADYLGIRSTLAICCNLQAVSCLLFVIQSIVGYHIPVLTITIGIESFCSGMCATAFITYLSIFCASTEFTGTHFTWLYSIGSLARVIISALSGHLADLFGWELLFGLSSLAIFPTFWAIFNLNHRHSHHQITGSTQKKAIS